MSEFIREHGEIIIAVLVFSILLSIALSVGPKLKDAMVNTVNTVIESSENVV